MVVVYYDLETTGLNQPSIIQIAASSSQGGSFSRYCVPDIPIEAEATKVHGIEFDGTNLKKGGIVLDAVSIPSALTAFSAWLSSHPNPVILLAHNGSRFDDAVLDAAAVKCGVDMTTNVERRCDSIQLLRKKLGRGRRSMKLGALVAEFLPDFRFDAHDAAGDAAALKALVETVIGGEEQIRQLMGF